jgi:predicted nucleic acid-binding protein
MIIVDTNIVSEFMGTPPTASVKAWLNAQQPSDLYLTTITIAEIHFGLAVLAQGERKQRMQRQFAELLALVFAARVLTFDSAAAQRYGMIRAARRAAGKPISPLDTQIAAIADEHHARLATRNTKDFTDCGLTLINPFDFFVS